MWIFSDINVSQGSVETHLRCGGIFYNRFAGNLLLSLRQKNGENWPATVKVRVKNIVAPFSGHGVRSTFKTTEIRYTQSDSNILDQFSSDFKVH